MAGAQKWLLVLFSKVSKDYCTGSYSRYCGELRKGEDIQDLIPETDSRIY